MSCLCILVITTSINCCKNKNIQTEKPTLLQWQQNYKIWNDWYQKLLYCICSNIRFDYVMFFFLLEQEDGSVITPMVLAHPLHHNRSRLRNKHPNLWVGWCASSWQPCFWSVYLIYYYIHTMYYSCILSEISSKRHIHTKTRCGCDGVLDDMILLFFPAWFQMYFSIRRFSIS